MRPANSNPSICSSAIFASSALLYLQKKLAVFISVTYINLLDECISLATTCHWILMQINKFNFTIRLEYVLDVRLCEIEVQRPNVKPIG